MIKPASIPAPVESILPEGQGKLLGDAGLPDLLPSSIAGDVTMHSIAVAQEKEIERLISKYPTLLLWSNIAKAEEPLLTHLAVHMHADIWDEAWSLEVKRNFLFRQTLLHEKKGTPWAVEEAVSLVYGAAQVREWFEYGGEPGCFKIDVEIINSGLSEENIAKITHMVETYQRKSQHLCGMTFSLRTTVTLHVGTTALYDESITIKPYVPLAKIPETPIWPATGTDILETIHFETKEANHGD